MHVSHQCGVAMTKPNVILGYIRSISSKDKEVLVPFSTTLVRRYLEYCVQFCLPVIKKDAELEQVYRRTARMSKRMESLSYKMKLKELGLFSLGKLGVRRDTASFNKYIRKQNTRAGKELLKLGDNIDQRTGGYKLSMNRLHLENRERFLTDVVLQYLSH